jgi:hypothetical protein
MTGDFVILTNFCIISDLSFGAFVPHTAQYGKAGKGRQART